MYPMKFLCVKYKVPVPFLLNFWRKPSGAAFQNLREPLINTVWNIMQWLQNELKVLLARLIPSKSPKVKTVTQLKDNVK